jgi:hypothetical protein
MTNSPFEYSKLSEKDGGDEGILMQVLETYIKSGNHVKIVRVKRKFYKGDYTDEQSSEVLFL